MWCGWKCRLSISYTKLKILRPNYIFKRIKINKPFIFKRYFYLKYLDLTFSRIYGSGNRLS